MSLLSRDVLTLAAVDAATCLLAGFAIFSILGYLALSQGKDVSEVVKEGEKGLRELTKFPTRGVDFFIMFKKKKLCSLAWPHGSHG